MDSGGYNQLRLLSDDDVIINLTPGTWSDTWGGYETLDGYRDPNLFIHESTYIQELHTGAGDDTITGNALNNTIYYGGGNDTISGGAGVDTIIIKENIGTFSRAHTDDGAFLLTHNSNGDTISLSSINQFYLDTAQPNVERILFQDVNLALDIENNAGTTAKIIGAVFGSSSLSNQSYVGVGLDMLDGGMSDDELVELALHAAGATTNEAVVELLYTNVAGVTPSGNVIESYVEKIVNGEFTQASLGMFAANHELNSSNINLVGLADTGIEYI